MSTFGTYNIAYSGLYVSQAKLATVTTNLANVNTEGASRVRAASADAVSVNSDGSTTSSGVSVASITRARNTLLDSSYRSENSNTTYYSIKSGNLTYMDEILNEFGSTEDDEGLQGLVSDFFDSWEELSSDPGSSECRDSAVESASSLLSALQELDSKLQGLQSDAYSGVVDGIDALNNYAAQVADLNGAITQAEAGGVEASYLRDQRDQLLDEMSSLTNITVTETDAGFQVYVGGVAIVNGDKSYDLTVDGSGTEDDPIKITSENFNCTVNISSGSIAAYLEDADQSGYSDTEASYSADATSSITNMRQALNDLVTTLAGKINSLLTSGYDLNGDAGVALFTAIDSSQPLSITNMQINPEILSDSNKLAASDTAGEDGNNVVAKSIASLASSDIYTFDGSSMDIYDFYAAVVSWLGTEGDKASSSYDTHTTLLESIDSERKSVSSISMDEEMSKMVIYQEAYNASAQVLSTIDSLLGDLMDAV